ncbi:hypothetical protein Tco_1152522 [Tanacetum coccineum]
MRYSRLRSSHACADSLKRMRSPDSSAPGDDEESSDDAEDAEAEEPLAPADPTSSPSPLSPYSSPLPQIPSPPLHIPSPPPNGPTYVKGSLGSRAAGIRQRDALPSPVHETEDARLYTHRFVKRLRFVLLLVLGLLRSGRVSAADSGTKISNVWEISAWDRPFHRRTALLMDEEARLSRAAWAQSMDTSDQVRSEGISLRTTVMAQQSEITELQACQTVETDDDYRSAKADHRRNRDLVETQR